MQKQTSVITCVPQTRQDREFQLRSEAQRRRRAREREMRERAREDTACAAAGVTLTPSTYSGESTPTFSVARSCHEVAELEAIRACLHLRRTLIRWAVTELEGLLVEVDWEAASTELFMDQQLEQRLQRSMSRVIATLDRSQALVAAVRDEPSACTCNGAP